MYTLYDLLILLPWVLDRVSRVRGMIEITDLNRLLQLDHTVTQSVHRIVAPIGQYVTGNIAQNALIPPGLSALWSFQTSDRRFLTFGKYYSYLRLFQNP
jgi:hypothetical protein